MLCLGAGRRTPGSAAVDGLSSACSVATSCVGPPATSFPPLCWAPCICTPSVVILCLAFHLLANVHSLHEHIVIFIIIVISSPHTVTVSVRGRRTLTHLLSGCAPCQGLPLSTAANATPTRTSHPTRCISHFDKTLRCCRELFCKILFSGSGV